MKSGQSRSGNFEEVEHLRAEIERLTKIEIEHRQCPRRCDEKLQKERDRYDRQMRELQERYEREIKQLRERS